MIFLFLYILQLLVFVPVFALFDINNTETISIVFVLVNWILVAYLIIIKLKLFVSNKLLSIILVGFFIRMIVLYLDVYKIVPILHSGGDSEGFHEIATCNFLNAGYSNVWLTYTNYSDVLSVIYMFCNGQRLVGQYLNVLLGMGVIYYIYLSCRELRITNKTIFLVITIICFFPTAIIFSGIMLREAWQEFFLAYSLFNFIRWFRKEGDKYIIVAILSVLGAAYMHSGSLCLVVGYLFAYIYYDPRKDVVKNSIKNAIKCIFVISIFLFFFFSGSTFTDRLDISKQMEEDVFLESLNTSRSEAGSVYLQWIDIKSSWQMILFSPLRMFYLMFSPIPFDWRGINDMIAFLFDSLFYLFFMYTIIKYYGKIKGRNKRLLNFIALSFLVTVLVFGYGTGTAGTAMRHRCKILSFILIAFAITYDKKNDLCLCKSDCFIY